jgi:putative phosphoribosyl transferase
MAIFKDRADAGRRLAKELLEYAGRPDVIVLGLPRGGVPVAREVAKTLDAPLDTFVVRKLGVPRYEELAMGAIASGGVRVLNRDVVQLMQVPDEVIEAVAAQERKELERRERAYRGDRPQSDLRGKTVIVVDDGLATGATMRAAVAALRMREPARIVIAVPTAAPDTRDSFEGEVDRIVCLTTPVPFVAVGTWYEDFTPTTDDEVRAILAEAA